MNSPEHDAAAAAGATPRRGGDAATGENAATEGNAVKGEDCAQVGDGIVRLAVGRDLDLHTFRPRDLPDLLPEWFSECRRLGIPVVRVIHGKGTGALRSGVHALLPRLGEWVSGWQYPAPDAEGGWGATLVRLRAADAGNAEEGPEAG